MTAAFEAAYHIGQTRLRGGLPSTDARFTDAKLLKLLTDELQGNIAPLVHNAKAEHGIVQYTVAGVVGTAEYQLPSNAFANTLRDVYWVDSNSNIIPLNQRSAADPLMYAMSRNNGTPSHYYMRGSRVVIAPPPGAAGTLALPHYARPSSLVLVGSTIMIDAVNVSGGSVFLTINYDGVSPFAYDTERLSVVSATPAFETRIVNGLNSNPDAQGGGVFVLEFDADEMVGGTPQVGDYLCLPGESPVPQCPAELFPLLHARAALVAVPSTGDMSQASAALAAQVADLEAKARAFLQPRVESGGPPPGKGLGSNPLLGVVAGSWNTVF